jgi:hypothetical protein
MIRNNRMSKINKMFICGFLFAAFVAGVLYQQGMYLYHPFESKASSNESPDLYLELVDSNHETVYSNYLQFAERMSACEPVSFTICAVLKITCADSNGQAKVEWLDPNNTEIDEGARFFFEMYLKSMCDEYIKTNCGAK